MARDARIRQSRMRISRNPLLPRPLDTRRSDGLQLVVLACILLVAAAFRLHGLETWDSDTHQHPDERFLTIVSRKVTVPHSLADYFNSQRSTLSPYNNGEERYAYGQLPLTLTRVVAEWTGRSTYDTIYGVGRALSALADLGTILFAWLLARRIFGVRTAHLAALLLAVTVLHIQLAHYFAVDTYVAFFAAASLFFGQRAWQRESLVDAILAGVLAGLATACKISAVMLVPVLGLAFVWPRRGRPNLSQFLDGVTAFGVALVGAFFAFRVAEPYAFLGPAAWSLRLNPQWLSDKAYQVEVSSGTIDVPFMIQWAGTGAYTFALQNIVQWAMGPALGLACLAGLVVGIWRLVRGHAQEREALLVLVWTLLNLAYFGGQFAKFLRYLLPTYFTMVILAAYVLLLASDWLAQARMLRLRPLHRVAAPLVVALTAVWALAFSHGIYDQPHSRIQASDWMYANIPAGATLATEHWDDRLPLARPGMDPGRYKYTELALYDPETPEKRTKLEGVLDQSQYVIMASRRLSASIPRLPERYPMATTYYRLLQSGQLGFELTARFQVEPGLGPLQIDDSQAQEDFTVYDHPLVEVWQKRADYSSATVRQLLNAVPLDHVANVRPIDGGKGALLQTPAEQQAQVNAGTWSQLFHRDDLVNALSVPVWLITIELIAFSSVPVLWRTLPFVSDRGFGASKMLGLASIAFVGWLVASLKLAPFDRPLLGVSWLALLAVSVAALWNRDSRASFLAWVRHEKRLLLVTEAVFLAGFGLFLFIRAANPDLWHPVFGGEKPMNFAYLNAVTKSEYFPPYDPWFAGGIINYYYFGFVLAAVPIKLTGILPEIAFNLAEPMLYGALCAGAFSLAFTLSLPGRAVAAAGSAIGTIRRGHAYVAGCAAVLLVGVLGNLDAGLQVLDQLWKLGGEQWPQSGGAIRLVGGVLAVIQGAHFPVLDFWRSTRFIGPEDVTPIHEFPYFTFLYGDLHAHQIALPLTVAVLLVSVNVMRSLRANVTSVPWPSLLIAGVLVAMLRATNTWDFPTYAAVVGLVVVLGGLHGLLRLDLRVIQTLVVSLIVFGIVFQFSFAPYLQRYQLFYNGVDPVKARTALSQFLTIHGLFFFVGGSLFAWYFVLARRRVTAARRQAKLLPEPGYYGVILPVAGLNGYASPAGWAAGAGAVLGLVLLVAGYVTRGFLVFGVGVAVAACIAHWRQSSRALQAALFGVALFATLIPEFVSLQGDIGRMNTVFKFYLQAWVLLSITSAVALGWLIRSSARDERLRQLRPFWIAVAAILVLAAAAYPLLASKGKVGLRFADMPLSLDGMQYMDVAQYLDDGKDLNLPGDARAIRWLQDNVVGTPVVLEGRSPVYRWGSRISIYTGLPTILGWDVHEGQQRTGYPGMIQERITDVSRVYSTTDPQEASSILRKYQVQWIVIGGLEQAYYPAVGLAKFGTMPDLRLAYDADGVQIYEVHS
jgi:YYY domain-containing protein